MAFIFYILALIPFYLFGSIPSGYLLGKLFHVDITKKGSGNSGATNAARILGLKIGLLTLFLDIAKGFLATALAYHLASDKLLFSALAGFATVLGHCFSIPNYPSGKGVATTTGVFLFLSPTALFIAFLFFIIIFSLQQIVSIASISAVLILPICTILLDQNNKISIIASCIALIVCYKHRQNIERFINGKEEKFKLNKKSS